MSQFSVRETNLGKKKETYELITSTTVKKFVNDSWQEIKELAQEIPFVPSFSAITSIPHAFGRELEAFRKELLAFNFKDIGHGPYVAGYPEIPTKRPKKAEETPTILTTY